MFIESLLVPGLVLLTSDYLIAHHHSVKGGHHPLHLPTPPHHLTRDSPKFSKLASVWTAFLWPQSSLFLLWVLVGEDIPRPLPPDPSACLSPLQ